MTNSAKDRADLAGRTSSEGVGPTDDVRPAGLCSGDAFLDGVTSGESSDPTQRVQACKPNGLENHVAGTGAWSRSALERAEQLSPREKDVIVWVATGRTMIEIGRMLGISPHTVEEHLKSVRFKLGTANTVHSVATALKLGEVELSDFQFGSRSLTQFDGANDR